MALADNEFDTEDNGSSRSTLARFFGVIVDPRAYGALVYMILALATGIFYFTWVTTGVSLSIGMMILIIGIPLALLFLGSVRGIAFVEAYIVKTLLGANIPVSERVKPEGNKFFAYIGFMLKDGRTWTAMLYMLLQLALGVAYFTIAVTSVALTVGFIGAPIAHYLGGEHIVMNVGDAGLAPWMTWLETTEGTAIAMGLSVILGIFLLFVTLHIARTIGFVHSKIAETLLVRI